MKLAIEKGHFVEKACIGNRRSDIGTSLVYCCGGISVLWGCVVDYIPQTIEVADSAIFKLGKKPSGLLH